MAGGGRLIRLALLQDLDAARVGSARGLLESPQDLVGPGGSDEFLARVVDLLKLSGEVGRAPGRLTVQPFDGARQAPELESRAAAARRDDERMAERRGLGRQDGQPRLDCFQPALGPGEVESRRVLGPLAVAEDRLEAKVKGHDSR
jgi:hypothetical protein